MRLVSSVWRFICTKKYALPVDKRHFDAGTGSVFGWIQAGFLLITKIRGVWLGQD